MSLIKFKTSVKVPKTVIIACAVVNAANVLCLPVDMLVTSGNDSLHLTKSKHYRDEALDFRTKHMEAKDTNRLITEVIRRLGKSYDVILEGLGTSTEHLHIEFDPA